MAKKAAAAAPENSTPLEQLTVLHQFYLARFNNSGVPMGQQTTQAIGLLIELFTDINRQLEEDDTKLAELEALLKKVEELLKKLEGINFEELDPERIKQRVLDALADWIKQREADLKDLRERDAKQDTRLDKLEADLKDLRERFDAIDFSKLDPEKIKQAVLDALAPWRSEIGNAMLALQNELRGANGKIELLDKALAELAKKVDGLNIPDLEEIKRQILAALADWRKKIEDDLRETGNKIADLETRVAALETWKPTVETRFKTQGDHLVKHDEDIAKLAADLKALSEEVGRIISNGGPDAEDIKRRVLLALAAWQQEISEKIRALDLRLTKDEVELQQHEDWILELQKQVAELLRTRGPNIDPEALKQEILAALEAWKNQISGQLLTLKIKLEADEGVIFKQGQLLDELGKKLAGLEGVKPELLKTIADLKAALEARISADETRLTTEVARLDARISAIKTTGVDPDDVRKIIEQEFNEWKIEITKTFVTKADLKALQDALEALTKRVDAIKTEGLSADEVKALLQAELGAWRNATDAAIADLIQRMARAEASLTTLDNRVDEAKSAIKHLQLGLTTLQKLVEEKLAGGDGDEDLKTWVLAEIEKMMTELDSRLKPAEKKIILLKDALEDLKAELEKIAANTPSAESIKNQVLLLLAVWQKDLSDKFGELKIQVNNEIKDLRGDLDDLEKRVNDIVLTGGTPKDVEERIRKAIEAWEIKLKRELNAIRQRNEEDRIGLLTLREMFSGLQERVRILEAADFGKAIRELAEQLKKVALNAQSAKETANDTAEELEKLTKQGGLLDTLQKHLNLLAQQSKHWLKKADVEALIEAALQDLEACKKDLCSRLDDLEAKRLAHETAIQDLGEADQKLREDFEKRDEELEEKIGQVGVLMAEADDELEAKIKDAEKDAKEYARDRDRELESKLDRRLDRVESRLDDDDERDEAQQQRMDDLQRQIDEWQPDPSGDAADRLARRCLEGRGIVCGFDVWHSRKYTLHIGPGAGVTSDGHIAKWCEAEHFTHYVALENAADYAFFVKRERKDGSKETWPVWRLVAEKDDETQPGVHPLSPQRSADLLTPFLQDKVVIALLDPESHPDPEKVRFVLMRRHDAMTALQRKDALQHRIAQHADSDFLFEEDFSHLDEIPYEDDLYHALRPELGLKEIPLPRFGLHLPDGCTPDERDRTNFPYPLTVAEMFDLYTPIVEEVFEKVVCEMRKVLKLYHRLLFPQFGESHFSSAFDMLDEKWSAYQNFCKKHISKPGESRHYIQYFYDWARDLINAYHELRSELLQLVAACCIRDANEHPRHLLLGLAMREEHNGLASPVRHEFVQPPIYNGNAARLEVCRLYLRRWMLLVKGFLLPIDNDPETNPVCCCDDGEDYPALPDYSQIKITPGRSYFHVLSRQSIPYYYLVTLGTQSVHRFWDYRRTKTLSENQHLCYHANDSEESYSALAHVIRPLHFSFDAYDFYRVEGHMGRKYDEVKGEILNKIKKYNLDFDVLEIEAKDCMKAYAAPLNFNTFKEKLQGAEHLAGVPKGGTFILVWENWKIEGKDVKVVIADFSVPYRCCEHKCGYELKIEVAPQCKNGKRDVSVTVLPLNLDCGKFVLLLDDREVIGTVDGTKPKNNYYSFEKGAPVTITLSVDADDKPHKIKVEGLNNPCCAEAGFASPTCGCKIEIESAKVKPGCENGQVEVEVKVKATNAGTGFEVITDGQSDKVLRAYHASGLNKLVVSVKGDGQKHLIQVVDKDNRDCSDQIEVIVPFCPIIDLNVTPSGFCNLNLMTDVSVTVSYENIPPNSVFQLIYDKKIESEHPYNATGEQTITLLVRGDGRAHRLDLRDKNKASLSASAEFDVPLCQEVIIIPDPEGPIVPIDPPFVPVDPVVPPPIN